MPCIYDSNALIPAPFVSVQKENNMTDDGTVVGQTYLITLKGKLLADKGSPNSIGIFWDQPGYPPDEIIDSDSRLTSIMAKQQALVQLFKNQGKTLEVSPFDGSAPFKCNPRIRNIEFPEGQWYNTSDYVITLEADMVFGFINDPTPGGKYYVGKFNEEWNIELLDEKLKTYRLTHSVSATGKRVYDSNGNLLNNKEAWQNAQDYVLDALSVTPQSRLGLDVARMQDSGVLDLNTYQAYNYVRNNNVNESAGIFSVAESWVCYNPSGAAPTLHERTISIRESIQDGGRANVSIEGTITGLEVWDNTTHVMKSNRYTNALTQWTKSVLPTLFLTAEAAFLFPLNSVPTTTQLGLNDTGGVITYHWEFDNRPNPLVSGNYFERITVQDTGPADVFAQIPVIGRPLGPVLQPMGTITVKKRIVTVEVQTAAQTVTFTPIEPNVTSIIASNQPKAKQLFVESDEESWTPYNGHYTRTTTFVWQ